LPRPRLALDQDGRVARTHALEEREDLEELGAPGHDAVIVGRSEEPAAAARVLARETLALELEDRHGDMVGEHRDQIDLALLERPKRAVVGTVEIEITGESRRE